MDCWAWLGFELVIAPALDLSQAKGLRLVDCVALAAHPLPYGLALTTTLEPREIVADHAYAPRVAGHGLPRSGRSA